MPRGWSGRRLVAGGLEKGNHPKWRSLRRRHGGRAGLGTGALPGRVLLSVTVQAVRLCQVGLLEVGLLGVVSGIIHVSPDQAFSITPLVYIALY